MAQWDNTETEYAVAKRDPEVVSELAMMEKAVNNNAERANVLLNRLSLVTRASEPKIALDPDTPNARELKPVASCELASMLRSYRDEIIRTTSRIEDALDRLEV